jgi:hypothetical protein
VSVGDVSLVYRPVAGKLGVESGGDVAKVLFGVGWRSNVVQDARFVVEAELSARDDLESRDERTELLPEIRVAQL